MKDNVKDAFLTLLRMGLWGNNNDVFSFTTLSKDEWSLIYNISISQTVEGLVYEGVLFLPKEKMPPFELLLRWTAKIDFIERNNRAMRKVLSDLKMSLSKRDFDFLLLKGLGLAENYRKPLLRVSGDIDLYFNDVKIYNKTNSFLKSNGLKIEKGDHHSVYYSFRNVEIEHHTQMIDIFNPFCQKYIKKLINQEEKHIQLIEIEGQMIRVPSYLLSQIQANAHILKHYLGYGIGLRQICDVARLYHAKTENIDADKLKKIYSKLGIRKWMNAMHNLLVNEIGVSESNLPYPIEKHYDTKLLLQDILNSGNFGFHDVRFRKGDASLSEKYMKRENTVKRLLPHFLKLITLAPKEVLWYPILKLYTKVTRK